ncbi:MAG TPA: MerR family transcriptional regulator [Gemmatimonadales bacterium]|nr:MerR family transcriptional regulator [Gemmatimonadales bacterium]
MNPDTSFDTPRHPVRLVANRTGLSPHVLRAWERRYAVVAPHRSQGGQRLYSDHDVERLRRLSQLTGRGHSISRIASLPLEELERLEEQAPSAPAVRRAGEDESSAAAELVGEALRAVRRLDAEELQAVLQRGAITLGGPVFLDEVVAPAVEAVGDGWSRGALSVAKEHMSTAVFRRVLEWQLGAYRVDDDMPRLVVATPPGESHELGALMVAVSAVGQGWGITYLGPDLPVVELLAAARDIEARAVALSTVYSPNDEKLLAAVKATREGMPKRTPLIIGGAAANRLREPMGASGAIVLDSLPELRAQLRELREAE